MCIVLVFLALGLFVSAAEAHPVEFQRVMVSPMIGTNQTDVDVSIFRDDFGFDRAIVSLKSIGYTDVRYVGSHNLPFFQRGRIGLRTERIRAPINSQHPGLGFRIDHSTGRPTGLLLSLADLRKPLADYAWFVDQRLVLSVGERFETNYRLEVLGRAVPKHEWYWSRVFDLTVVPHHARLINVMTYCAFRREFGWLILGMGVRVEGHPRGHDWDYTQHATGSIRFERQLSRAR